MPYKVVIVRSKEEKSLNRYGVLFGVMEGNILEQGRCGAGTIFWMH